MKEDVIIGIFIWVVGVIVSLVVGFGILDKTLTIPGVPEIINLFAGWIVIVGAITSAILVVFTK